MVDEATWEAALMALANAMGFVDAELIVRDYLQGRSVISRVGRHGRWHFDHMTRTLGREPPAAATPVSSDPAVKP